MSEVDEEKWALPVVSCCSAMMYKYYSHLGFIQIKYNKEGKYMHKEVSNNIPHRIKNILHVNCLNDVFGMYNYNVSICKL